MVTRLSKAIDDVNSEVFTTTGGASVGSDPFNRRVNRGLASFDVPQRFVATFIYELPTITKHGLGCALLGGYSVAGTYRLQSGHVQSPFVGGIDLNRDGSAFNDRPAISNPSAPANSVGFSNFIAENFISGVTLRTGLSDVNGTAVNPADVRFLGPRKMFRPAKPPRIDSLTSDVTDTTFNDFRFNSSNLNIGNVNADVSGSFSFVTFSKSRSHKEAHWQKVHTISVARTRFVLPLAEQMRGEIDVTN